MARWRHPARRRAREDVRAAFVKALNSPELLAEAKQKNMEVELITGEELATLAKESLSSRPRLSIFDTDLV